MHVPAQEANPNSEAAQWFERTPHIPVGPNKLFGVKASPPSAPRVGEWGDQKRRRLPDGAGREAKPTLEG